MRQQEETGFAYFLIKYFSPLVDLTIRLYMANIFFKSGWLKFQNYMNDDWDSTIFLFTEVHPVPYLSPETAAVLGTAGELGLETGHLRTARRVPGRIDLVVAGASRRRSGRRRCGRHL